MASDGKGGSVTGTLYLTVAKPNEAPRAVQIVPPILTDEGADISLDVSINFADPEMDQLSYSIDGLPRESGMSFSPRGLPNVRMPVVCCLMFFFQGF